MKPAFFLTLCLATVLRAEEPTPATAAPQPDPGTAPVETAAGNDAAPAPTAPVASPVFRIPEAGSATTAQQQVSAKLPDYDPDASKETKATGTVGTPSPDALELPKMTIRKPKERPRLTPEFVITNKALEEKAAPLDKLLNSSSALGGASAAERAREEMERKKRAELVENVDAIAKAVEAIDPAQAKALRDAAGKP